MPLVYSFNVLHITHNSVDQQFSVHSCLSLRKSISVESIERVQQDEIRSNKYGRERENKQSIDVFLFLFLN